MKKTLLAVAFSLLLATQSFGQTQPALFSIRVLPDVGIPLLSSADYFQTGFGGLITGEFRIPSLPFLFAAASLGYDYQPALTTMSMSSFAGLLGAGVRFDLLDWLTLRASGQAGYYYAMMNGQSSFPAAYNPVLIGEAGVQLLREPFRIDIGAQYRYYHGLYSGLSATAGLAMSLGPKASAPAVQTAPVGQTVQVQPLSVRILPDLGIPLLSSASYFQTGFGGLISTEFRIPSLPFLFAAASLGYDYQPVLTTMSLSSLAGLMGVGVRFDLLDWLTLRASGQAGYYYASVNGQTSFPAAYNPVLIGEAGVQLLREPFRIDIGAQYRYYYGLYSGLSATAGVAMSLGPTVSGGGRAPIVQPLPEKAKPIAQQPAKPAEQPAVEAQASAVDVVSLDSIQIDTVFPVFYKYYDDHMIGKAVLTNKGSKPIDNVKVLFQIKQYMDAPKQAQMDATTVAPGESKNVDIYALFTDQVLQITEATKVASEITVSYVQDGKVMEQTFQQTVRVQHRNAMMWDDNNKAAAFVTAKDPTVLIWSNNVNAMVKTSLNKAMNHNLQLANAIHDSLMLFGLSYVQNPLTPYSEISKNKLAVDTLKFPRQTFDYKSGDCSDLSILYCALLESLQIETAFITIPGHIFMAFSLGITPDDARQTFTQVDNFIFRGDKSWVPLEITERDGGFQLAWDTGAKEWRENLARQQADLYPLHDGWAVYEPVGLPGSSATNVQLPPAEKLVPMFKDDVHKFIAQQIFAKVAALQAQINKDKDPSKSRNSLGVLYARYDLTAEAEAEFQKVLKQKEYSPALLNEGNILYQKGSYDDALSFYQRAYKLDQKNPRALLAIARAEHELEDYGQVKKMYDALKKADPDLAQQFAYLDLKGEESTRAAEVGGVKEVVLWEE